MRSYSQLLLGLGLVLLGVLFLAPAVHAGILDASWVAPTTNADGSPLTDLASYKLYYGTSPVACPGGSTFVTIASPTTSPTAGTTVNYRLTGLQGGTTYYLGVTAVDTGGIESPCSNQTSAAARNEFSFTDPTPAPQITSVKAVHFTELRSAIDTLRTRNGLQPFTWTDLILSPGITPVKRIHLIQLRTALNQAYQAAGQTSPTYTDPGIVSLQTPVKAVHLNEVRTAVNALP